jgi:uncharacterized membrane protein
MLGIYGAIWNLCLAGIPFLLITYLYKHFYNQSWSVLSFYKKTALVAGFGAFILFLPNIPYLFTDYRHIVDHCEFDSLARCVNWPVANLLYFTYAALGIPLFVLSIEKAMKLIPFKLYWIGAGILVFLSALGVSLGLFERFNSWNIVHELPLILGACWDYFLGGREGVLWQYFGLLMSLQVIFVLAFKRSKGE